MEEDTAINGNPAITLALRGERIPLHSIVSSTYNPQDQQLLVASGPILSLYGKLLETGGELLATLPAEDDWQFQRVLYISWLHSYSVIAVHHDRGAQHHIVSADLKHAVLSHAITDGSCYSILSNPYRHEIATSDSDGGLKVWVIRAQTSLNAKASKTGGMKGILRAHTAGSSTRKPSYRHLCLNHDGQKIFAGTSTRVHIIDAASCTLLASCFRDQARTIARMDCSPKEDTVFIIFKDDLREIIKYTLIHKKSSELRMKKVTEHTELGNCVAFCVHDHRTNDIIHVRHECVDNWQYLFTLDECARFGATTFSRSAKNDSGTTKQPVLCLPFNPFTERYIALHGKLKTNNRNLIFAVWSSGFCSIEAFVPNSGGRLVNTIYDGERMKAFKQMGHDQFAIYQQLPIPCISLLEDKGQQSVSTLLRAPRMNNRAMVKNVRVIDFDMIRDWIIVLWSSGTTEAYRLGDDQVQCISPPFEHHVEATAMIVIHQQDEWFVAVGDTSGLIRIFGVINPTILTQREAHCERISILCNLKANEYHTSCSFVLSAGQSGEVKVWSIVATLTASSELKFEWHALVCFHTYSTNISATTFVAPEFLFCGFDGGGLECWQLPPDEICTVTRPLQQSLKSIKVIKRALHSIDLHLTPVLCMLGQANELMANKTLHQPHDEEFSWVVSYDQEGVVLIWCFNLEFLFPHRRIKVHDSIKGSCLVVHNMNIELFVYTGRCIENLDEITPSDKHAAQARVRHGRELSAQYEQDSQNHASHSTLSLDDENVNNMANASSSAPSDVDNREDNHSVISAVSPVRISITLPVVNQKGDQRFVDRRGSSAQGIMQDTQINTNKTEQHQSIKPRPIDFDSTTADPEHHSVIAAMKEDSTTSQRHGETDVTTRQVEDAIACTGHRGLVKSKFIPEMNSLPSSFRQAKPRVYRNRVNPWDSMRHQERCALITTNNSNIEDNFNRSESLEHPRDHTRNMADTTLRPPTQEKVTVVSLVNYDKDSVFMLDFGPNHRLKQLPVTDTLSTLSADTKRADLDTHFLSWNGLTEDQRQVELMAATRSRIIRQLAEQEEIRTPSLDDFESRDIKVQLVVHTFSRWFAATSHHRQINRERFLMEELLYAAKDPELHIELVDSGRIPPPTDQIGAVNSTVWHEFVSWYSSGRPTSLQQKAENQSLLRERLNARTKYLQNRLNILHDIETKIKRDTDDSHHVDMSNQVFIFEDYVFLNYDDRDKVTSWERTSLANRQKEIALALLDPTIQIAAIKNEVELPDFYCTSLKDFDISTLADQFVSWWKAAGNKYRDDFLKQELEEASEDRSIRELIAQELTSSNSSLDVDADNNFQESYFQSDKARLAFLKKKLFYMKRKSRISSIAKYGKLPMPIVFESVPLPVLISFQFPECYKAESLVNLTNETISDQTMNNALNEENQAEMTEIEYQSLDDNVKFDEVESKRITMELGMMSIEDELSREYNMLMAEESDEEDDGELLSLPKRSNFSRSYFFGNLPVRLNIVSSSDWQSGSGIDNGDEEFDEEEELERERLRQQMLEQQEIERLAEEARKAERARIEKEQEEKAIQLRRLRQAELKSVLVHQSELETAKKKALEVERMEYEMRKMGDEELSERQRLKQMAKNQSDMEKEDQLADHIRKEQHAIAVVAMRRLLNELTQMAAEDRRSAIMTKQYLQQEREQNERKAYLMELYSTFQPFFPSSSSPSEEFLPAIQARYRARQCRTQKTPGYAVPFAETLVMDEIERDTYIARDSRKFNVLMGIPPRSSQSRNTHRIPTEEDIIKTQQKHQGVDAEEERSETPASKSLPIKSSSRRERKQTPQLPDLMAWKTRKDDLCDINQVYQKQNTKQKVSENHQQQQNALPFFRGNMIVRGEGKSRSKDYFY